VGPGAGIDTAWDYGTQSRIPPAIEASRLTREEVFITTKIPCDHWDGGVEPMNATMAEFYVRTDLEQLNTSYVDLLLLHHICKTPGETAAVWQALEQVKRRGHAKAIGVSNFEVPDLMALMQVAVEPIAANQCHFGVGEMDVETLAYCREHNIAVESYGTLHGGISTDDPKLTKIAARNNLSAATLMLKYVSQHNITIVTASDELEYDEDDIAMFGTQLSPDDMQQLDAIQGGKVRTCSDCWKDSCRACQAALAKVGCQPWSNTTCIFCANDHTAAVMPVCKTEAMVYKACINN
jgi:2,5-diketo-D-gluconate reductase A